MEKESNLFKVLNLILENMVGTGEKMSNFFKGQEKSLFALSEEVNDLKVEIKRKESLINIFDQKIKEYEKKEYRFKDLESQVKERDKRIYDLEKEIKKMENTLNMATAENVRNAIENIGKELKKKILN